MRNKYRGFTLIEVMVALSILTVVFATMASLVAQVINLAMISRDKTEATALVQKGLSDYYKNLNDCNNNTQEPVGLTVYNINNKSYNLAVTKEPNILIGPAANQTAFNKITATVTWDLKGKNYTAQASQFVRVGN